MFQNNIDQYYIKLPQFEGPFDLILFFIERDEIEIQDIPISKITADFLHYIQQMEQFNIELASEFIVVAATLMNIKTRMLLPRKEVDEQGNEIDPRAELVQRLMEYKQFKAVLKDLQMMEADRAEKRVRGNLNTELQTYWTDAALESEWESVDLYRLYTVFSRVMDRFNQEKQKIAHTVVNFPYTIVDQRQYLIDLVPDDQPRPFDQLFANMTNRLHAIVTFLALLELINNRTLMIRTGESVNSFFVHKNLELANTDE